jgi:hypothetical protein
MVVRRAVLLAAVVIGTFLLWLAKQLDPGVATSNPTSLAAALVFLIGGLLYLLVWGYCFYWAVRTGSCLWILMGLLLGVFGSSLQAIFGPVAKPKREAGATEVAIPNHTLR